jgi:Na+/H+-dicarboxylate symporter
MAIRRLLPFRRIIASVAATALPQLAREPFVEAGRRDHVADVVTTSDADATRPPPASRLSRRIVLGVGAGAAAGLLFGEQTAILQVVADGYIRLLQMTVLPYVTISIVGGLGALDAAQARMLGKRVGAVLLLVWTIALAAALLISLIFPAHESASFFSATLLEERERFDFLSLYIPANPFNSRANNIGPAVVLFSIVVGLALVGVPGKARLSGAGVRRDAIARAPRPSSCR